MEDDWYTDSGATGRVTLKYHDNGWYFVHSDIDDEIRCKLLDETSPADSDGTLELDVTVSKFRYAIGSGPSYLFVEQTDEAESIAETPSDLASGTSSSKPDKTQQRQTTTNRSFDRTMLDNIPREKIEDEEFTISREDVDSVIGQMKKRARRQGRYPAIDPTFRQSDEGVDDKDD